MQETQETWIWSLAQEDPLEEGMATYSSILACRIPQTEEPSGLQSRGSQRVRHDWSNTACTRMHIDVLVLLHQDSSFSHHVECKVIKCWTNIKCGGQMPFCFCLNKFTHISWVFPSGQMVKFLCCCCLVTQSCLTLCDPMDYRPPGSSVPGILQARILE